MDNKTREKISKVYELVNRGVNGEKQAAKKALDRLMKKYNLNQQDVEQIKMQEYRFKYSSQMEMALFVQLKSCFLKDIDTPIYKDTNGIREMLITLEYLDYVVISSSYEYFRKHMRQQFNKFCLPKINRCKSSKTRNKRRKELQNIFLNQYIIASKLYKEEHLQKVKKPLSEKELKDMRDLSSIEGGKYHTQMTTGLYLNQ